MARPTKYNEDMLGKAEDYIIDYKIAGDSVPSIVGLADVLSVDKRTLYNWAEEHEEFFTILERVKTVQEKLLLNKGLEGDFNSNIVKLMLGKHGYSDKQDMRLDANVKVDSEFRIVKPDGVS